MQKSAIVVAASAEDRRSIAQIIKPTEFFQQIHFCSSLQETRFLLEYSHIDILFCDADSTGSEALQFSTELSCLAEDCDRPLIFFSRFDPLELPLLDVLPRASHSLSYEAPLSKVKDFVQRLLRESVEGKQQSAEWPEKLIDQNSGAYTQFYFDAFVDQQLSRSKLTGSPFSLLLIEPMSNVEQEKNCHWSRLLPAVAGSIKNQIRTSDLLCRIENQRLALLLPETTSKNAKRVMQRIQVETKDLGNECPLAVNIGLASPGLTNHFNRHGLLREAEATL